MIIFTADWHLHPFLAYSTITERGLNSRLAEQISAIMGIIKWGSDHGATHMIHAGDVFHAQKEHLSKDVLRAGYVLLENAAKAGMKNIIIPGNHDIYRGRTVFRPFQDVAEIIIKPTSRRIDGDVFTFIPYQRLTKNFTKHIEAESEKIDWGSTRTKFLVCHQMFAGAAVGPSEYQFKVKHAIDPVGQYDYVVAGHCHKAQIVGTSIYYPGSPLQHDHGDSGDERGFLAWDGEDMTFMPITAPQFHTVKITDENDHRIFVEDYIEGDYYKIIVDGELEIELPRSEKIEVLRKGRTKAKGRVETEHKQVKEIIKEAVARYDTKLDKEEILNTVLKFWEESKEDTQ